jgi:hypothetical protein
VESLDTSVRRSARPWRTPSFPFPHPQPGPAGATPALRTATESGVGALPPCVPEPPPDRSLAGCTHARCLRPSDHSRARCPGRSPRAAPRSAANGAPPAGLLAHGRAPNASAPSVCGGGLWYPPPRLGVSRATADAHGPQTVRRVPPALCRDGLDTLPPALPRARPCAFQRTAPGLPQALDAPGPRHGPYPMVKSLSGVRNMALGFALRPELAGACWAFPIPLAMAAVRPPRQDSPAGFVHGRRAGSYGFLPVGPRLCWAVRLGDAPGHPSKPLTVGQHGRAPCVRACRPLLDLLPGGWDAPEARPTVMRGVGPSHTEDCAPASALVSGHESALARQQPSRLPGRRKDGFRQGPTAGGRAVVPPRHSVEPWSRFLRTPKQSRDRATNVFTTGRAAQERAVVGHPSADRFGDRYDREQALCPYPALCSLLRLFSSSSPCEAIPSKS